MAPGSPQGKELTVPDLNHFELPPQLPGNSCNGYDKAISLDINDTPGGLELTICTFIEYELEGVLSTEDLLSGLEESVALELNAAYVLKGALSTGIKITVPSLTELPSIELDPITLQLHLLSDPVGSASLGLFAAALSGTASLQGQFSLGYCPSCNGKYSSDQYYQVNEDSAFYFSRSVGFDMDLELEFLAGMPGAHFNIDAGIRILDDDVFDEVPPVIQLPDTPVLRDLTKFSPQNAVGKSCLSHIISCYLLTKLTDISSLDMLRILDATLLQITRSDVFDTQIPLLKTSIKSIISMAPVFTNAMFQFFVTLQPFEDRDIKSLLIKG
jgi:hypothetical protein